MSIAPILRGFRLQDLYIIWRILSDEENRNGYFLPEGSEDLLIFDSEEKEIEAVQVKALKKNVTVSRLGHDKPDGFFTRQTRALTRTPALKVTLASFGPIGPELRAAIDGEDKQLASHAELISQHNHLSKDDAIAVLRATTVSILDETQLTKEVREWLERSLTGIDPDKALAVLQTWIRLCAESGSRVRYEDLISEVESIGKFLRETAAHNLEWHITIRPIEVVELAEQRKDELAEGFYQGSSVQYEHILAQLDVERPKALSDINSASTMSRVVVVKAASGQGKSAIAYRFIHNFCSARLCYRVEATEDPLRAGQIALALSSHAANIGVPMLAYLDVRPTDYAWRDIVLRLAEHQNIQLLITIREEDWTRGALSKVEVDHEVIEVEFSEDEAKLIYEMLQEKYLIADTVNFEDAWNRFGREGQLIEFVHFIFQGESLRERLEKQVRRLKEEVRKGERDKRELQLLRLVAIATAFEARIKVRAISQLLDLPEPEGTIRQFEREYLFRTSTDGTLITSLHPIRSEILMDLLTDPALDPWLESAALCVELVIKSDLANFLLYVFAESVEGEPTAFLDKLNQTEPDSWETTLGIMRGLLWYGLARYVEQNRPLFDRAYSELGQSLTIAIDLDVANAANEIISEFHDFLKSVAHEQGRAQIESYLKEQTDKGQVFDPLRTWLDNRNAPISLPTESREWIAYSEVAFWVGWSNGSTVLISNTTPEKIWDGIKLLPLDQASRLLLAVYYGARQVAESILSTHRNLLIERVRRELQILQFEDDGEVIVMHFIMALLDDPSRPKVKDIGNYEAIKRIDICRSIFPDRKKYCTFGYGHRFADSLDSTEKRIEIKNLPLDWPVALNAQFGELVLRKYRPDSWKEFAETILKIRQDLVHIVEELIDVLKRYFARTIKLPLLGTHIDPSKWGGYAKELNSPPLLPKQSGDRWGFVRISDAKFDQKSQALEQDIRNNLKVNTLPPLAIGAFRSSAKHLDFWKAYKDVIQAYSNFLVHGQQVLALNPALGIAKTEDAKSRVLAHAEEINFNKSSPYLTLNSVHTIRENISEFQSQIRRLLSNWLSDDILTKVEEDEQRVLETLWHYWHVLAFHPEAQGLGEVLQYRGWEQKAFGKVIGQFRNQIQTIGLDGLRIIEPGSGPQYQGKAAMWVVFNSNSLSEAEETSLEVISAMADAEKQESIGPLQYYVYEEQCSNLIVTPLVGGRSVEWLSYVHNMGMTGIQKEWEPPKMTTVQCPEVQDCGVEKWEIPLIRIIWDLRANTYGLAILLFHLQEIMGMPDLDQVAVDIIQEYVRKTQGEVQSYLDRINLLCDDFKEVISDENGIRRFAKESGRLRVVVAMVKLGELLVPIYEPSNYNEKGQIDELLQSLEKAAHLCSRQLDWLIEAEVAETVGS